MLSIFSAIITAINFLELALLEQISNYTWINLP